MVAATEILLILLPTIGRSIAAEREYTAMTQGVVAGTVLAILVPILIAVGCFICHLRQSYKEKESDFTYRDGYANRSPKHSTSTIPMKPSFSSGSQHTVQIQHEPHPSNVPRENINLTQFDKSEASAPDMSDSDGDDDSDNASTFDGEYDTNEPIDNRPVNFKNVLWHVPGNKPQNQSSESAVWTNSSIR